MPTPSRMGRNETSTGFSGSASESTTLPSSPGWQALLRLSIAIAAHLPSGESWTSF